MPRDIFDAEAMMRDEGLQLLGRNDDGTLRIKDRDGSEGILDLPQMLKDNNINPNTLDVQINTPKSALNISPVGVMDRAKLMLGNAQGKIGYLKNKFEDVKYDKDTGLVVKNKGIWHTVDPEGLGGGDPWEMTKELVKDVIDVGDIAGSAVASGAGATLGAAAGPAGAIAGAGAGGGLAEGLRTSLGRLAGTYVATPEEQLKDIGIEALLNLGGETVGLGAKATLKGIGKAFKTLGEQSAETSKDLISESMGRITGAGPQATRTMIDQTDDVVKELTQAKASSRTLNEVVEKLRTQQLETAQSILEDAPKALTQRFGQLKSELVSAAKDMPMVNVGQLADESLASLEASGLLKREVSEATGKAFYKVMDDETAIAMRNAGKNAEILAPNVQAELEPIVRQLNKFTQMGEFEGPKAAATLMDLKRTINDVYRDMVGPGTSPGVKGLVDKVRTEFATRIGGAFNSAGLTPQYMSTVNLYQKYSDAVNMARRMANQENGAELFLKKIVSDSGANRTVKDLAADLADLMGVEGLNKINQLTTKEAAKAFTPWLPRTGFAAQATLGASAAGAAAFGPGVLGEAALTSPRLALNSVDYGRRALGLIQSLNPTQRFQLLKEPQLLDTFFRTTFTAPIEQEMMTQQLTNQAAQAAGGQR
jgi:hypothetical protein